MENSYRKNDLLSGILATTLLLPLNGVVTNFIKLTVGRPRPDFAYRCWPQTHGKPANEYEIFKFLKEDENGRQDLNCHGDHDTIVQGRKSFPSGHSSFAFATFVFTFLYLSAKLRVFVKNRQKNLNDSFWIWKFLFVVTLLIVPTCLGISRTCDYHHHWQDVTVGSILGTIMAIFIYLQYYPFVTDEFCEIPLNHQITKKQTSTIHSTPLFNRHDSNYPNPDVIDEDVENSRDLTDF